jgi:hypothetical protein
MTKTREPIEIPKEEAEKLGELAVSGVCGGAEPVEGWDLISTTEEGQSYGYLCCAIFHRRGDPENEAWQATFDVQSASEVFVWGDSLTFYPRTKVTRTMVVTSWE